MKEKERDRSGDGAGPVAPRKKKPCLGLLCGIIMLQSFLFFPHSTCAQRGEPTHLRGLSLIVDVGVLNASDVQANFYNGAPTNVNTLQRILYSESYGPNIWNNLTEQDLIGSAVSNYNQITVAEYGEMYYKLAFQLGLGFRYDLEPRGGYRNGNWAWQLRFDYAKLHAQGMVLLNSGKNQSILSNQNAYVDCPTSGLEERIYIDLGLLRRFKLRNGMDLEAAAGVSAMNTKVESSDIMIAGVTYSILDVWAGQSPSSYTGSYEYVNQGGIGVGGYASLALGFTLPAGTAMSLGYTFYYNKVNLEGYTSFEPHHAVKLNVALNNFSLFD